MSLLSRFIQCIHVVRIFASSMWNPISLYMSSNSHDYAMQLWSMAWSIINYRAIQLRDNCTENLSKYYIRQYKKTIDEDFSVWWYAMFGATYEYFTSYTDVQNTQEYLALIYQSHFSNSLSWMHLKFRGKMLTFSWKHRYVFRKVLNSKFVPSVFVSLNVAE